jgi:transposase
MADAEAICEAVTRANMQFVPTKTPEQQSCLMLHRTRGAASRSVTSGFWPGNMIGSKNR